MIEAVVNQSTIAVEIKDGEVLVNGQLSPLDITQIQAGKFLHLLYKHQSYYFEIVSYDSEQKQFAIAYQGQVYTIGIKDRFDQLLKHLGLDQANKVKINEVKAPMPGLVLSLKVAEQQAVKKGDAILILEAMKMENVIKSPIDGVIKQIVVSEKQAVDKNQTLVLFQ